MRTLDSQFAMNSAAASLKTPNLKLNPPNPANDWQYDDLYGDDGNNNLNGGEGSNNIVAEGGNDYLFSGNNNSTWHGVGNEFAYGATRLDGGSGNDVIQVWADRGAFSIETGKGADHVKISSDADYVKITSYGEDANDPGDMFEFGMAFSGEAVIVSFDQNDELRFNGVYTDESTYDDWTETNYGNGVTIFHNDATGGIIEVHHDSQHQVRDTFVDKCSNGWYMLGGDFWNWS